jgi:hypothetical protein
MTPRTNGHLAAVPHQTSGSIGASLLSDRPWLRAGSKRVNLFVCIDCGRDIGRDGVAGYPAVCLSCLEDW